MAEIGHQIRNAREGFPFAAFEFGNGLPRRRAREPHGKRQATLIRNAFLCGARTSAHP
jgi:hypothetical protein